MTHILFFSITNLILCGTIWHTNTKTPFIHRVIAILEEWDINLATVISKCKMKFSPAVWSNIWAWLRGATIACKIVKEGSTKQILNCPTIWICILGYSSKLMVLHHNPLHYLPFNFNGASFFRRFLIILQVWLINLTRL